MHNSERENQVILIKFADREKLHYLAMKKPIRIAKRNYMEK